MSLSLPEFELITARLPVAVLLLSEQGRVMAANSSAEELFGQARKQLLEMRLADLVLDPPEKVKRLLTSWRRSGQPLPGALQIRASEVDCRWEGSAIAESFVMVSITPKDIRHGRFVALSEKIEALGKEVLQRQNVESLMAVEKDVLERIARGAPLGELLEAVTQVVEQFSGENVLASVLLLEGTRLRHGAAPSLPDEYNRAIDGVEMGPSVGSCGTAVYRREQVIVEDIANDPLWADYRDLALSFGLQACWSSPIFGTGGRLLGTFALYYRTARPPSQREKQLIGMVMHTAAIAIERGKAEQERAEYLEREREARREAEEASRLKDEFLATISHELRTPLTAILGWARLLREGNLDEATMRKALENIERNSKSQAQLIEDLLDVSRIVTGKLRLDFHPVEVPGVVHAALESIRPSAAAKGVRLEMAPGPAKAAVAGDTQRLQQVVWNLLSNAVKFTPKGGEVTVRLEERAGELTLTVTDTGEGMPPELVPSVFDAFRQADHSASRKHGGLGLGLTIVRQLVDAHSGSVSAESAGPGRGSTFRVVLPLLSASEVGLGARWEDSAGVDAIGRILDGAQVLVVEDEDDIREMVSVVLQDRGAMVRAVTSAAEAMEALREFHPDVLVSDIGMPGEDGYTLIRRIRSLPPQQGADMPAIALTGYARREDRAKVLGAGYQVFLSKPVDPAELLRQVARLRSGAKKAVSAKALHRRS